MQSYYGMETCYVNGESIQLMAVVYWRNDYFRQIFVNNRTRKSRVFLYLSTLPRYVTMFCFERANKIKLNESRISYRFATAVVL